MPKQKRPVSTFGARLLALRKARGFTQAQLAEAISSSQRMISHYESTPGQPTAPVIAKLAAALGVTADQLLGLDRAGSAKTKVDLEKPEVRRLWKKFQKLLVLPTKDQRAVIRLLNSLAERRA